MDGGESGGMDGESGGVDGWESGGMDGGDVRGGWLGGKVNQIGGR